MNQSQKNKSTKCKPNTSSKFKDCMQSMRILTKTLRLLFIDFNIEIDQQF